MDGFLRLGDNFMNLWRNFRAEWASYLMQFIALAILFYLVFKILKANKGEKIIALMVAAVVCFGFAFSLSANIESEWIVLIVFIITLLVVTMFSVEIKRSLLDVVNKKKDKEDGITVSRVEHIINETIRAVQHMSKNDVGALIVLSNNNLPEGIISSGTVIDADINAPMIEAVFYPKAPLHDGAMIILGDKIHAAGCFLPIIQNDELPQEIGSRHRAALGVTVAASVTAIVVSEETGIISIVKDGEIKKRYASDADLKNVLSDYYWSDLTAEGN